MEIVKNIKYLFNALKNNWKRQFRLVLIHDDTHQEKRSILLTPKRMIILIMSIILLLIFLTILLIAFTPLRYYIPGYANPDDLRNYRQINYKIETIEKEYIANKDYMDMLTSILNEKPILEEDEVSVEELNRKALEKENLPIEEIEEIEHGYEKLEEEAEMIYAKISEMSTDAGVSIPLSKRIKEPSPLFLPPTYGDVISNFNIAESRYGIQIKNSKNTLVNSIADGTVIYSGFDPKNGNTIVVQHAGNVISLYKNSQNLLKRVGSKVKAGEPIAKIGNRDKDSQDGLLIFEIWINGFPVNPLDYIIIN